MDGAVKLVCSSFLNLPPPLCHRLSPFPSLPPLIASPPSPPSPPSSPLPLPLPPPPHRLSPFPSLPPLIASPPSPPSPPSSPLPLPLPPPPHRLSPFPSLPPLIASPPSPLSAPLFHLISLFPPRYCHIQLWPWMKDVCKETSAFGGVPCNPPEGEEAGEPVEKEGEEAGEPVEKEGEAESEAGGGGGSSGGSRGTLQAGCCGMVQDGSAIDGDGDGSVAVAAAADDSASSGGGSSSNEGGDRDWFTREWGHSGMVQNGAATDGGDGGGSDSDGGNADADGRVAVAAAVDDSASSGGDSSSREGEDRDWFLKDWGRSGMVQDTAEIDRDDGDGGADGRVVVAAAVDDSASSGGGSSSGEGENRDWFTREWGHSGLTPQPRSTESTGSTDSSFDLGHFAWPLDGSIGAHGGGDAYIEDGSGGQLDAAAAADGVDVTESKGGDYNEDVIKEERDENENETEQDRDYMALAAKDVSFALIPRGSSSLDETRGGKGGKGEWNKEGAGEEGGVGGAKEGSVKGAKGGKIDGAEGRRVEGAAAGRVEGAAAAGGGFKRHPNTPMQPQRSSSSSNSSSSSSSSKQSSGQGSRGATKQRSPAMLKGPVPFPFTIQPPTTNPMAGILTWPVTSVKNSNSAGDTSPPSSSQPPSPARQPSAKRPKGGCTSLRAVYVLNITTPADFNLRLQIPPNVTVVMYLQNNLVLSSGLVFGVGFSCSLLMSTVGMWPGYTIEYSGSDMPAFKVENASNIVSVNVNWKVGVAPGSAACVGFQGADKTSVCPAIAIHRSYGVQVGAVRIALPPSLLPSPFSLFWGFKGRTRRGVDVVRSMNVRADSLKFTAPSLPSIASPAHIRVALSPASARYGGTVYGRVDVVRSMNGTVYGRVDVVRSMNVRVDSLEITAPSLPSVASPAHIRVALSGIGPSLLKSNVLITNNEVYNARIGIVLHRGAVGVAVASNYVHGFTGAGIMCGAGPRFVGDCMLVNVSNNVVQAPWGAMPGAGKAIGIVFSTHWINPGNVASCNYVVNGALCYDLDAQSSGVLVQGGACMYAKQGVRINNGKMNVVKHVIMNEVPGTAGSIACPTVTTVNCLKKPGSYWEAMRLKYYNSAAINT
ncbi:unnamed protein product, partial [Closterium sp. Naga37s-1]